ncbi:sugar transferase [Aureispira anguillae]|uniref:Sugar transferase n=1 Tax=Aureispira anguillae TaxID=2864201 RepID=A0A916DQT8_9BACT|nr:sugar transferase [Aureispira anguillae]BDS09912.1 sugar transferase [Aureispira anguillae]
MKSWRLPKGVLFYAFVDYLTATLAWFLFVVFRRVIIEGRPFESSIFQDNNFLYSMIVVPIIWIMVYIILDSYRNVYRMSRLAEFARTIFSSLVGGLLLFFTLLLDDLVNYLGGYHAYYLAFGGLLCIHFCCTVFARMLLLTIASNRIHSGKFSFNTVIIGSHPKIESIYLDIINRERQLGYNIVGYVSIKDQEKHPLAEHLNSLGTIEGLNDLLIHKEIEEVILALDKSEHTKLKKLIGALDRHSYNILVRAIPEMRAILLGKVNMPNVRGAGLLEIKTHFIPIWLRIMKRSVDVVASLLVLILFSPLYLFVAIRVRLSSEGPIFYKQERIGRYGKPFMIYKFRSMYLDAEKGGPQLSSDTDDRCTPWGRIMRKYRLDEIPQFWNVLKGDMSLVGPRPERQFFINQIAQRDPRVHKLHKVRPGITSWGQVQYGYASNVDEMIDRLKIDLIYIENLTLGLDVKIMIHTVLVILRGSGK